jgi:hypothetical protein
MSEGWLMRFDFFVDKIAIPLMVAATILAITQIKSSFVTTSDFYEHKVEAAKDFTSLHIKLDYLLKSSASLEEKLESLLKMRRNDKN